MKPSQLQKAIVCASILHYPECKVRGRNDVRAKTPEHLRKEAKVCPGILRGTDGAVGFAERNENGTNLGFKGVEK